MKILSFLMLFIGTLVIKSCKKDDVNIADSTLETSTNYLVFGYVGLGRVCGANVIYKIENGKLYADTSKIFCKNQENYSFSGYQLPESEYNKAKVFVTNFPVELANEKSKTFGCPGCADGGMLFIQLKTKGQELKTWRIDDAVFRSENDTVNQPFPKYLSVYGQKIGEIISEIKYN
ncbi:MAG: hypothetical protein V4585_02800 [Bacteroidota bacterium]